MKNYKTILAAFLFCIINSVFNTASADVVSVKIQGPTVESSVDFICPSPNVREEGFVALGYPFLSCSPYLLSGFVGYNDFKDFQEITGIIILSAPDDGPAVFEFGYEASLPASERPVIGGWLYVGVSGGTMLYPADGQTGVWVSIDRETLPGSSGLQNLVLPSESQDSDIDPNESWDYVGPFDYLGLQVPSKPMNESTGAHWRFETTPGLLTLQFTIRIGNLQNNACEGDLNIDHKVDQTDFEILNQFWGSTQNSFDISNDGVVDGADLGMLLANYGSFCE